MNVRTRFAAAFAAFAAFAMGAPALAQADAAKADPFTISVNAPAAKVGADGVATVEIKPASGYHFNKDYPTSLKLVPVAGVAAPAKLGKADAGVKIEEAGASFEVKFKAAEPGKKALTGQLSFAVCTATTCDPRKAAVTINLDVK